MSLAQTLLGFEPKLIKLEFIIYLPKLKVAAPPFLNSTGNDFMFFRNLN